MQDNQNAINSLKITLIRNADELITDCFSRKTLKLAVEALEKQIPIKGVPYNSGKNHSLIECGACNKEVNFYYKYCPKCGQMLDWSSIQRRNDGENNM